MLLENIWSLLESSWFASVAGYEANESFRGEGFSIMEFHNADTTFCQVSKLFSSGASILPKQRHCTSNFRWEEQLVIKNNNPEVFEFYFPWLPHAQNLNSTDGSCAFVFNILMHFSSRAGWSLQPGFVGGMKDLPDPGLFIPPCL